MSGVTGDVIQKIENGRIKQPRNVERIAEAVQVSPAWLQFGVKDIDKLTTETIELALKLNDLDDDQREIVRNLVDSLNKR